MRAAEGDKPRERDCRVAKKRQQWAALLFSRERRLAGRPRVCARACVRESPRSRISGAISRVSSLAVARGGREVEWKARELCRRVVKQQRRPLKLTAEERWRRKLKSFICGSSLKSLQIRFLFFSFEDQSPPFVRQGNVESRAPPANERSAFVNENERVLVRTFCK